MPKGNIGMTPMQENVDASNQGGTSQVKRRQVTPVRPRTFPETATPTKSAWSARAKRRETGRTQSPRLPLEARNVGYSSRSADDALAGYVAKWFANSVQIRR